MKEIKQVKEELQKYCKGDIFVTNSGNKDFIIDEISTVSIEEDGQITEEGRVFVKINLPTYEYAPKMPPETPGGMGENNYHWYKNYFVPALEEVAEEKINKAYQKAYQREKEHREHIYSLAEEMV